MRSFAVVPLVCLLLTGSGVKGAEQPQCLHGTGETPEQQARRREALRLTRLINTAEANQPGAAARRYLSQEELSTASYMQRQATSQDGFMKSLNFTPGQEVLPGWELKLDVTADGYWFMIRDKIDPCGFAFVTNQAGLIYTAEPIR